MEKYNRLFMEEGRKHFEMFNYYYMLGDKRSLRDVAEAFDEEAGKVRKWSTKLGWVRRVEARDKALLARMELKEQDRLFEMNKRQLENARDLQEKGIKHVKSKEGTFKDGVTAVKEGALLERLISGEPTSREEIQQNVTLENLKEVFEEEERKRERKEED